MRIKVPFEVAVVIIVALLIFWAVFGAGHLASWLEKKFSKGKVKWAVRILGYIFLVPALLIANTFYFEQNQRDEVYRGLYKFDLGEVILAVALAGAAALCWFWARWRLQAALGAVLAGLVALGIILLVRWKILRDREKVFGPG